MRVLNFGWMHSMRTWHSNSCKFTFYTTNKFFLFSIAKNIIRLMNFYKLYFKNNQSISVSKIFSRKRFVLKHIDQMATKTYVRRKSSLKLYTNSIIYYLFTRFARFRCIFSFNHKASITTSSSSSNRKTTPVFYN